MRKTHILIFLAALLVLGLLVPGLSSATTQTPTALLTKLNNDLIKFEKDDSQLGLCGTVSCDIKWLKVGGHDAGVVASDERQVVRYVPTSNRFCHSAVVRIAADTQAFGVLETKLASVLYPYNADKARKLLGQVKNVKNNLLIAEKNAGQCQGVA